MTLAKLYRKLSTPTLTYRLGQLITEKNKFAAGQRPPLTAIDHAVIATITRELERRGVNV